MSWIAYYVEESSRQQQEEYARSFAHRRPDVATEGRAAVRPPAWRRRLHRAGLGVLGGRGARRPARLRAAAQASQPARPR